MHSQRQGRLMACLHFSLIGLMFSSHIPRKDIVRQPPSSASPCTPFPTCPCEMGGMWSTATSPRESSMFCTHPTPWDPAAQFPTPSRGRGSQGWGAGSHPPHCPQSWAGLSGDGQGVSILSFEGPSLTLSLTFPCTFAVAQQPDFTEILRSEACFSQNDPQASQSSIHQYCSLQGSALVSFPALNKLAEIPELVRTAWCCP